MAEKNTTPNGGNRSPAPGTSTKYDAAVRTARGEAAVPGGESTALATQNNEANLPAPVMAGDVASLVSRKVTVDQRTEFLNAQGYAWAPTAFSMRPMDLIQGILEGRGHPASINGTTPDGKPETRIVDTWVVRHPTNGRRISILSSVQLAKKLVPFIGELVGIFRDDDLQIAGGRRVGIYEVRGPDRPGLETAWTTEKPEVFDANVIDLDSSAVRQKPADAAQVAQTVPSSGEPTPPNMEDRS